MGIALLAPLFSILAGMFSKGGAFSTFFSKQADIANASIDLQKEIVKAQVLQAEAMAKAQLEYQAAALNATMPLFKQHMFWFLSIPVIYTVVWPSHARVLWDNFRLIPDFYWSLYSAIVLTIWGIPVASNLVSTIFSGFTSASSAKRQDNIELEKVSSEQYKAAFFSALRAVEGHLGNKEVTNIDKALDTMGK